MTYDKLLPELRDFTRILVTGPQRSGTTVAAKALSEDLGLAFLAEKHLEGAPHEEGVARILAQRDGFVLQCPGVAAHLHRLDTTGAAVVWMVRDAAETAASWEKLGGDPGRPRRRNATWQWQKRIIQHPFELEYESLSSHPLWVPKEEREGWDARQISRDRRHWEELH